MYDDFDCTSSFLSLFFIYAHTECTVACLYSLVPHSICTSSYHHQLFLQYNKSIAFLFSSDSSETCINQLEHVKLYFTKWTAHSFVFLKSSLIYYISAIL